MKTINTEEKLSRFSDHWHPRQIAVVDDMQILLAKLKGEFVWHKHDEEDELFQVLKGTLILKFRDSEAVIKPGELIVVPKGVEHCPMTLDDEEVHVMLFEKLSIKHTGDVIHEKTRSTYPKI